MLHKSEVHEEGSEGAVLRSSGNDSSLQSSEKRAEGRQRDPKEKGSRKKWRRRRKSPKEANKISYSRPTKARVVQMTGFQALGREF